MSWRSRISWRWIIRGTCLGLLGLCVALWGLSYFYFGAIGYGWSFPRVVAAYCGGGAIIAGDVAANAPGWKGSCFLSPPSARMLMPTSDVLGFMVIWGHGVRSVQIPFWFLTAVFAVASWVVWRKSRSRAEARGFPVEPVASQRQSDGG